MPATAAAPVIGAEDVNVIRDVTWETYCRLNDENVSPSIRMAYFGGTLEIMTVSARHENWGSKIEALVYALSGAREIPCEAYGRVTLRRKDLSAGLEPDACFYFGPLAAVMCGREELDLNSDPSPDLVVEVDISRRSFSKFPLYAALGIREIWRFHQGELSLYELDGGEYRPIGESVCLPHVTAELLTKWLAESRFTPGSEWLERLRESLKS